MVAYDGRTHGGETMEPLLPPTQTRGKEKTVAGILGILLGGLGIHHFYLGSTVAGVIELAVTVVTCGFGAVFSGIAGLVEGIMLLTMSDEEFNQRYNQRTPESMEFVFMKPKTMGGGGGVSPTPPPPPYQT
jgi:TM2 domain-containing membrane protein YozV